MARYGCRYKTVDWFSYSEEEEEKVKKQRREKSRASPPKTKNLNDRYSREYFKWLFHNNFAAGDYFVTLTFANLTDKKNARREFTNYIKRLRRLYRKAGSELKYLYVYEGKSKGTRPHFHIVINKAANVDRDSIERLWKKGYPSSKALIKDDSGLCDSLCEYLTKEMKQAAKFERCWNCSSNLKRPDRVIDDDAVTRKRMCKVQEAKRNDEVKKYVEAVYIGWALLDYDIGVNNVTGRPYARFRLLRKAKKKGVSP